MTDNLTPPGIPAVFVEAAKEAGVDLSRWRASLESPSGIVTDALGGIITIGRTGKVWLNADPLPLPDAIRLANRLVRALTGETEGERENT